MAFSTDCSRLVSVGRDQVINVWNLRTYSNITMIPAHENFESILTLSTGTVCPGGNSYSQDMFLTAGEKGILRLWDVAARKIVHTQPLSHSTVTVDSKSTANSIANLLYRKESGQIIAVTQEHDMCFFDLQSLRNIKTLAGFTDDIIEIKSLPNRKALVASNSAQLRIFDLETMNVSTIDGHTDNILALDVSSDGKWAVSSSKDLTVRLWSLEYNRCIAVCRGHTESITAAAISKMASSTLFAISSGRDRTLKKWDCQALARASADRLNTADMSSEIVCRSALGHEKEVNVLSVSPNNQLIASGSMDRTVALWNADDLKRIGTLKGHKRGVWSVAFSDVDKVVATAAGDSTIKVWSVTDFTCLKTFEGHANAVQRVTFLNKGLQLLSAGADGLIKLWTIKTNECVDTYEAHSDKVWALELADSESRMLTGGADSTLIVWEDATVSHQLEDNKMRQDKLVKKQRLINCFRNKEYHEAVRLALDLEQPRNTMSVFEVVF